MDSKSVASALDRNALADQIERDGVTVHGVWHPAETVKQMIVSALRAPAAGPVIDAALSSDGGVDGHAPEGSASAAASGLPERRPRDMEAAGWQREAETGRSPEMARVREQASNCESQDSDRIAGPTAARGRAGVEPGPSEAMPASAQEARSLDQLLAAGQALYDAIGDVRADERPLQNDAVLKAGIAWCAAKAALSQHTEGDRQKPEPIAKMPWIGNQLLQVAEDDRYSTEYVGLLLRTHLDALRPALSSTQRKEAPR